MRSLKLYLTEVRQMLEKLFLMKKLKRKYDDDEIEDARLEVMEADENIKRKKGDFIAEGLILKRRSKAYNKVIAAEFGIDLSKQTPEQYKKSLKHQLDNIERKERNKTDSALTAESVEEKKEIENALNTLKTFKEDAQEKTGLSARTINDKLKIAEVFEDKIDLLLTHLILGGFFYPQKTNKCLKLMSIYGKI